MLRPRLLPWEYGVRNLLRRPWRSGLTFCALTTVILLVLFVVGFIRGLEASLSNSGDPRVVLVYSLGMGQNMEYSAIPANSADLLAASLDCVKTRYGRTYASPELYLAARVAVAAGSPDATGLIRGITPAVLPVRRRVEIVEGAWPGPAEAFVRVRQAELESAQARLAAARTNLQRPVYLEAAVAEAEAELARVETELSNLPFEIRAAEARLKLARQNFDRKLSAGNAVPGREVQQARTELDRATAELEQFRARKPRLTGRSGALERKQAALQEQLKLKTAETRDLAEAQAGVKAARAQLQTAEIALAAARLRLERMTVRAPVAGRVLDLVARPGTRVMGLSHSSRHEAATVVTLYDPARLQVRADVRLEDLSHVVPGQAVRIETATLDHAVEGEVLFATSVADIQKNTLEVKVAVKDPPPMLKPEMLVQATFLAPATDAPATDIVDRSHGERLRIFVPKQLVDRSGDDAHIWIADQAAGVARRLPVKTGGSDANLVEVVEGMTAGARLIVGGREGLRDGRRIRIGGETITPLDGVDLDVRQGQFVSLMGTSGTGKSTLLNLLAGIDRPDEGSIFLAGTEITRLSRTRMAAWRSEHIGYIFQMHSLVPVLTAYENVELPLLLLPLSRSQRRKRVEIALEAVGLGDRAGHLPRQLSGGQEQRVGIARAIVADPTLVVADEPTGDLDDDTSEQIVSLLKQINRQLGTTLLMVTHDREIAAQAWRQLHLERGRLSEVVTSGNFAEDEGA